MDCLGLISDIQHFCCDDGPGIRTTVFFKGCSLSCIWCHNPECISQSKVLQYFDNLCVKCAKCVCVCPYGVHSIQDAQHIIQRANCSNCGKCVSACPNNALKLVGQTITAKDLSEAVLKDKVFYDISKGGVTCSGGEALLQVNFLQYFLKGLKSKNIHVAIDTAGNVPWDSFEKIIDYTDLFLFDVKIANSALHKRYCGSDNTRILDNLNHLCDTGKEIWIRIPLIPGINDSIDELGQISKVIPQKDNITRIQILPYHTYGIGKYSSIGIDYCCNFASEPSDGEKQKALNIISSEHRNVSIG